MSRGPSIFPALLIGAAAGGAIGVPLAFAISTLVARPTVESWRLVPVVVAAVDLRRGEPVTFEMISQRSMPARFLHDDDVQPDEASTLVGQVIQTTVLAGDTITWAFVDEKHPTPRADGPTCAAAIRAKYPEQSRSPAVARVLDRLEHPSTP